MKGLSTTTMMATRSGGTAKDIALEERGSGENSQRGQDPIIASPNASLTSDATQPLTYPARDNLSDSLSRPMPSSIKDPAVSQSSTGASALTSQSLGSGRIRRPNACTACSRLRLSASYLRTQPTGMYVCLGMYVRLFNGSLEQTRTHFPAAMNNAVRPTGVLHRALRSSREASAAANGPSCSPHIRTYGSGETSLWGLLGLVASSGACPDCAPESSSELLLLLAHKKDDV